MTILLVRHAESLANAGERSALPDTTVVFGHGIWLIMLHWLLAEHPAEPPADMQAFQRYRLDFAMPNCAAFSLESSHAECSRIAPVPLLTQPATVQSAH